MDGGEQLERTHRRAARGRSEATPWLAHLGVIGVLALGVGAIFLVAFLLWIFLR